MVRTLTFGIQSGSGYQNCYFIGCLGRLIQLLHDLSDFLGAKVLCCLVVSRYLDGSWLVSSLASGCTFRLNSFAGDVASYSKLGLATAVMKFFDRSKNFHRRLEIQDN